MARLLFPDAASVDRVQATADVALLSASGAQAKVYLNEAGTQLADIRLPDGSAPGAPGTLVLDNQSRLPDFQGPTSGAQVLYVRVDGGGALEVEAKLGQRFAAQSEAVTAQLAQQDAEFDADKTAFLATASATYPLRADADFLDITDVTVALAPEVGIPVDVVDGVLYGRGGPATAGTLYRSLDNGDTWQLVESIGGGINSVRKLGDGEVLVFTGAVIYRSTGWAVDPMTATFAPVLTASPGSAFPQFGVDVAGNLALVAEYAVPREPSIKAYLSTDFGKTFTVVRDLNVLYPGQKANVHWHAAGIDYFKPGTPRLWLSHGDGPSRIIYSDDLGGTWTTFDTVQQPTTLTATKYGMVVATDQNPDGVYRILRTQNPGNMRLELIHQMRYGYVTGQLYGFATRAFRDETTGVVYIAFRADSTAPAVIFATDGLRAQQVYEVPQDRFPGPVGTTNVVVTPAGRLLMDFFHGTDQLYIVRGTAPARGTRPQLAAENGTQYPGGSAHRESIGIGFGVDAPRQSVVLGDGAEAVETVPLTGRAVVIGQAARGGTDGVVIGQEAVAPFTSAVAIGSLSRAVDVEATAVGRGAFAGASAVALGVRAAARQASVAIGNNSSTDTANSAVAIGDNAKAFGPGSLAVGLNSVANLTGGVALGLGAMAQSQSAVALGQDALVKQTFGIAIGQGSVVDHQGSVALGRLSATTTEDQVAFGPRRVLLLNSNEPPTPANGGTFFVQGGALKFKGSAGTVTTVAAA